MSSIEYTEMFDREFRNDDKFPPLKRKKSRKSSTWTSSEEPPASVALDFQVDGVDRYNCT